MLAWQGFEQNAGLDNFCDAGTQMMSAFGYSDRRVRRRAVAGPADRTDPKGAARWRRRTTCRRYCRSHNGTAAAAAGLPPWSGAAGLAGPTG